MAKTPKVAIAEIDDMLAGFRARVTAINDILLLEGMDEEGVGTGYIPADEVVAMGRALEKVITEIEHRFRPPEPVEAEAEEEDAAAEPANDTAPGAMPEGSTPGKRGGRWTAERRAEQANRMRAMQARKAAA